MILRFILACLVGLCLTVPADAQTFPKLTGRVVDQANLLDPAREAALTQKLAELETNSGRQLVVATLASLEGRPIEDYGYRLGRQWGIGSAERDDGVLLIVAPNERKVRIETGYGARVFLTDAVSSVIIRNAILPRFRDNDYPGGIEAGVDEIATQMQLPPAEAAKRVQEAEATTAERRRDSGVPLGLIFWGMVVLFVFLSFARRGQGRRYRGKRRRDRGGIDPWVVLWGLDVLSQASRGRGGGSGWGGSFGGGGGGGGGFGGFSGGGGSFGGGGASGSW